MLRHSTSDFIISFSYINIRIQTQALLTKGERRQTNTSGIWFFVANLLHSPSILDILSEEILLLTHSLTDTTELKLDRVAGTPCFSLGLMMPQMFQSRDGEKYRTKYSGYKKIKITILCQDYTRLISCHSKLLCTITIISRKAPVKSPWSSTAPAIVSKEEISDSIKKWALGKKKSHTQSTYTAGVCLDKERQRWWGLACITFITSLTLLCSDLGSNSTFICYLKLIQKPQPGREYTRLHHKLTSNLLTKENNGNFKNLYKKEFSQLPSPLQNR